MSSPLLAFLIKLPLALLVFLLVAYAGTASRRIAGVLFTFPILNAIAIIASDDPVTVADAIYPLVIFNCVLFGLLISHPRALPPVAHLPRPARLFSRIISWSLAWLAGAFVITQFRGQSFGTAALLIGAIIIALCFMWLGWSRIDDVPGRRNHAAGFVAFWMTTAGLWRVVFFILTYACLFWAARVASDQKWVGMASALPLPGLFALAALIDDAETRGTSLTELRAIRDTLFLGPLLVIPFNWTFSHALLVVPAAGTVLLRYLLLLALWMFAALAVVLLVPRLARVLDRR
jgi:uncharacterized membrane protein